ncbi:YdaS family helix-turn-helix protein [Methylobacillus pratensis]
MSNRSYLKKLVGLAESQALLADKINKIQPGAKLAQAHVWKWLNSTALGIPGEYVISACHVVNWQVTPHQLRPDLYPHPADGLPEAMRINGRHI